MRKRTYTKWLTALLLSVSIILTQSAVYAAAPTVIASQPASSSQGDGAVQYKLFLKEKYDISFTGKVTKGQFIEAIAEVLGYEPSGEEVVFTDVAANSSLYNAAAALFERGILSSSTVQPEETLTTANAIYLAVRAADLKELAYTYPAAKVNKALSKLKVASSALGAKGAQEVAAAVDTGLLPAEFYTGFKPKNAASEELVNTLLGKVLTVKGQYKKYIGYVSDADIYAKLNAAYEASDIIHAPKLQELVNTALEQNLVTGYSLKDSRYEPNFIDSLSLTYGHSDLLHAIQLIGLLRSEGIDAKVQFEPKTSAFIFLAEWGEPGPNVVQIENGNYINYDKEYELAFEFATEKDKAAFDQIILTYAKKNEGALDGLIYGSWWQPLYYSNTKLSNYELITNNLITDANSPYIVNSFSLNEDAEAVVAGLKAIDADAEVTPYTFWVDQPFFRYLHGESQ